jgi:hypothetical protein
MHHHHHHHHHHHDVIMACCTQKQHTALGRARCLQAAASCLTNAPVSACHKAKGDAAAAAAAAAAAPEAGVAGLTPDCS